MKKKYKVSKSQRKSYILKSKYNLTTEQYLDMYYAQQGCCAICGKPETELKRSLYIDHNHKTGKVRGLLCPNCNFFLGYVKENIDTLLNMATYLYDNQDGGVD